MLIYFTHKKEYIGAAYGISRNVSSKLSRSTNHPLHGHNFSNSDLYTFALQAKGSPPLLACFPKADFEPTRSEASFIPSLCEARLPSGPQFVSTARSIEWAFFVALVPRAKPRSGFARNHGLPSRTQRSPPCHPAPRPSTLARSRPLLTPRRRATPPAHFHRFPLVFAPHATSHPKSL